MTHPPKRALGFLRWFCREDYLDEIEGDLTELYEKQYELSPRKAKWKFAWNVVKYFRPEFMKSFKDYQSSAYGMYKSYFKVGWRNLTSNKAYSAINILSLAVGMGVCLLICQYLYFELSYDRFHTNFQYTYRIAIDKTQPGADLYPYPYETGYAVGVSAKEQIPEINQYVRVHKYSGGAVVNNPEKNKPFTEDALSMFFVDKTFLQVFDFPLKEGSKEKVFDDKFNIVITEKAALKYFGSDNPVGKTLTVSGGVSPGDYSVSGVLEELPINSHLQFDFLMPVENYMEYGWGGAATKNDDGWSSPDFATYVTIDKSADPDLVCKKLNRLIIRYKGTKNFHENITEKARLQPVADIHLKSDARVDSGLVRNTGNILDVKFFLIVTFFILLIAWVNYINLSTTRSIHRAKEVGIRKSIGAFKTQLMGQFLVESAAINSISALLSIGIATLALPVLTTIIEKKLELSLLQLPMFWVWFLIVVLLGSLFSGLYPAFVLSSFKPVSMLGATRITKSGNFNLRKGLITFQFLTSLVLISGTYLVYQQITFMKTQELGIEVEKILVLKGPEVNLNRSNLESTLQSFTERVADHHSITAVATSSSVPGKGYNTGIAIRRLGTPASADKFGRVVFAGYGLPTTYNLEFMAGKSPTQEMLNGKQVVVVINEEALKAFDLGSAENAIHERLYYKQDTFMIAGVVRNFHWHSLADAHTPYLFEFYNDCRSYFSFKINLSNVQESLSHIESTYNSFFPGNAFDYFFLENEFNKQYQSDVQFGKLFFAFTVLAIFIACIGLFSLVSYSITSRSKEIGIRKVLGAGISNIIMLLSREYLMLLLIANVLAIPAILYGGEAWLDNYAFKTELGLTVILIPGLVITFVSLMTVSYQTYSAANANPVESLKLE